MPRSLDIAIGAGSVPGLDGEVTSSAEIVTVAENEANAGNSYWMRDGAYGALTLGEDARPSSLITFTVYPGEQVTFTDVSFERCANLRFDGNEDNMVREGTGATSSTAGGGFPDGEYGLWFRGSGITGNNIPPVGNVINFVSSSSGAWNENLQFAHFRLGDDMAEPGVDDTPWRRQHGIVIADYSTDLLFEDFEIAYIGNDNNGEGDFDAGGYGLWWFDTSGEAETWGNYTFRRGHWHHTMNDFIQYGPKNSADGLVLFEDCLFEELYNYGAAHADFFQALGGSTQLTFQGCVFQYGSDYLLHGSNPGATRLFENCLIGNPNGASRNAHQIVLGKDADGETGASDYEWRDCTILMDINGIRCDSTLGAATTADNVVANCIWGGAQTESGVILANYLSSDGEPNLWVTGSGGTALAGDATGSPTFNSDGDCTSHAQGYRKSATFPWSL